MKDIIVTDFMREGIPDSGGSIRKRRLSIFICSDVGYVENPWISGGTELPRRRVDREKI